MQKSAPPQPARHASPADAYAAIREATLALTAPLSAEDCARWQFSGLRLAR